MRVWSPTEMPVIACDVDGVLADFFAGLYEVAQEVLGSAIPPPEGCVHFDYSIDFGIDQGLMRHLIAEANRRYPVSELPYVEGAEEAVRQLSERFRFVLVTGRPDEQYEVTLAWAEKRVPGATVCLGAAAGNPYASNCGRKTKAEIARKCRAVCFIDDNPQEFFGWDLGHSSLPICFAQPWNKEVPRNFSRRTWPQITHLLLNLTGRP